MAAGIACCLRPGASWERRRHRQGKAASCWRPRGGARGGDSDSSGPAPAFSARLPTVGVARGPGRTCWGQSGLRPLLSAALSPVPPCSSRQLTPGPLSSLFSERAPLPPPSTWAPGSLPLPCSHLPQKVRATCLNFAPMVAGLDRAQRLKSRLAPDMLCVFGQSCILLWPSFPSASLRDRRLVDLSN